MLYGFVEDSFELSTISFMSNLWRKKGPKIVHLFLSALIYFVFASCMLWNQNDWKCFWENGPNPKCNHFFRFFTDQIWCTMSCLECCTIQSRFFAQYSFTIRWWTRCACLNHERLQHQRHQGSVEVNVNTIGSEDFSYLLFKENLH